MKSLKFALILILVSINLNAWSWGATGHRAMGLIAERYLNPTAKKKLQKILKGESLAMASTWMDEIRSDSMYDHTADWHWVTIESNETYEQSKKNVNGDVIMTIERIIADLKAKKVTGKQEIEYIKMLIHLIGDIHQPLHVGCCDDRGGNRVRVKWHGRDTNLHTVWDSELFNETNLSYTELANALGKPTKEEVVKIKKASVREWAKESMGMRKQVYAIGDGNLGYKYSYKNLDSAKYRLLLAGIRLADVLNSIYG
jgi:hypothetical protein